MARISAGSLNRIMGWLHGSPDVAQGDQEFFIELVERIRDDSWRAQPPRWYIPFDPVDDVWDCQPRPGLHVWLTEEPIGDHEWMVRVVRIYYDPGHSLRESDLYLF